MQDDRMQESRIPNLIGELHGILATFEWANGRNDLAYTFTFEELPPENDIQSSLARHFGNSMTDVRLVEIEDWSATLGNAFRNWLFQYMDLLKSSSFSALTDHSHHEKMIDKVLRLVGELHPIAVWQVQVNLQGFYECAWDDFAIEIPEKRFLLHLGVSD
jgi:hypothetical protein